MVVSAEYSFLRKKQPERPRGFRVPLVPLLPWLSILSAWDLMMGLPILTWLAASSAGWQSGWAYTSCSVPPSTPTCRNKIASCGSASRLHDRHRKAQCGHVCGQDCVSAWLGAI